MRLHLIAAALLAWTGACARQQPSLTPSPSADPIEALIAGRDVIYAHVIPFDTTPRNVGKRDPLGTVEGAPLQQSVRHQDLLDQARRLYDEGRFGDAVAAIRPAVDDEPSNLFVLNEYARALFRIDSLRLTSGPVYERLVSSLAAQQQAPPDAIVIDAWFVDAYWKLALLYLDVGDYRRALYHLTCVAIAPGTEAGREQLYSYFAEAFFHLNEQAAADWAIQKTLEINPANEYVLQFRKR